MSEILCGLLQLVFISRAVAANLIGREGHVERVNKRTTSWGASSHIRAAGAERPSAANPDVSSGFH